MSVRGRQRVVRGEPTGGLDGVVRQLWLPAVKTGRVRVAVNPHPSPQWHPVERYWLTPTAGRVRLLVPRASAAPTSRMLWAYRRLRSPATRAVRSALAATVRVGLPPGTGRLEVQSAPGSNEPLPLGTISDAVGLGPTLAMVGVLGENRKVTLQLFDIEGRPRGYAKMGWNDVTDDLVATEASALAALDGGSTEVRTPRRLAAGRWGERPFVVSAPLPGDAASVTAEDLPVPHLLESVMPTHRWGPVAGSARVTQLAESLRALPRQSRTATLRGLFEAALDALAASTASVPIASRWHGDLTPWNCALDTSGALWVWDWESSSVDTPAGLDTIHWLLHSLPDRGRPDLAGSLRSALALAGAHLDGFGVPREGRADLARVYAASLVERVWAYAARSDGWSDSSLTVGQLEDLLSSLLPR